MTERNFDFATTSINSLDLQVEGCLIRTSQANQNIACNCYER